jgi:hypothetical protein
VDAGADEVAAEVCEDVFGGVVHVEVLAEAVAFFGVEDGGFWHAIAGAGGGSILGAKPMGC